MPAQAPAVSGCGASPSSGARLQLELSQTGPGSHLPGSQARGPRGAGGWRGDQKDEGEEERRDRCLCHPSLGRSGSCWTLAHWPVPVLSSAPAYPVGPEDCAARHRPHVTTEAEAHGMKSQLAGMEPGWPPSTA